MEKTKKLLYITTRIFWPTDSGRKVSLYYYCKGLHEKYNYEIYVYSFLEAGQNSDLIKEKPDFIKCVNLAQPIGKFSKLKNLTIKTFLQHEWPLQCSLFYSKDNSEKIKKLCNEINPEVIIVDMVRLAPYYDAIINLNCKKILNMDDLLSERYQRQINSNSVFKGNPLSAYNISNILMYFIKQNRVKNFILKLEQKLMYEAELKYAAIYDKVIFVSDKESGKLNEIFPNKSIDIPLGVNVDEFTNCKLKVQKENNICFVGNMYVAANIDTLKYISTEVLPYVKSEYTLYIIGKVSDQIKKCKLFLSPIIYGSGIKTKILEAMAMQLPVITNDVGAEGLDVENKKHLIIENNSRKIADLVDYYLKNEREALTLAANAQKLVFEKYNWNNIWKKFRIIL